MRWFFNNQETSQTVNPFSIPVPWLKQPIGAGDAIHNLTQGVGIQQCAPCEERQKLMNQAVRFRPWGE